MQNEPTLSPAVNPDNTVLAAVQQQMQQELNEGPVNDQTKFMLLQKYGFAAPQLTQSEQNLVRREERRNARHNSR